jgi:MFS family permease
MLIQYFAGEIEIPFWFVIIPIVIIVSIFFLMALISSFLLSMYFRIFHKDNKMKDPKFIRQFVFTQIITIITLTLLFASILYIIIDSEIINQRELYQNGRVKFIIVAVAVYIVSMLIALLISEKRSSRNIANQKYNATNSENINDNTHNSIDDNTLQS